MALVLQVAGPSEPLGIFSTDDFKPPVHLAPARDPVTSGLGGGSPMQQGSGLPFPKTRGIVFLHNQPATLPGWAVLEVEQGGSLQAE